MSADDVVHLVRGFMVAGMVGAAVTLTWAALTLDENDKEGN